MKNIRFDLPAGYQLTEEQLLQRMQQIMVLELTACQQAVLRAYHFEHLTLEQIAQRRGTRKSTVWRTLKRAEKKLYRMMQY